MTFQRRSAFLSYLTMAAALALAVALAASADEAEERAQSDRLYQSALAELEARSPTRALPLLEQYLDFTRSRAHRPERVFWAIDQAGYLYLGVKRDPAGAIAFFGRMRDDPRLDDLLLRVEATRAYPPKALPAELAEALRHYERLAHPSDPTA